MWVELICVTGSQTSPTAFTYKVEIDRKTRVLTTGLISLRKYTF